MADWDEHDWRMEALRLQHESQRAQSRAERILEQKRVAEEEKARAEEEEEEEEEAQAAHGAEVGQDHGAEVGQDERVPTEDAEEEEEGFAEEEEEEGFLQEGTEEESLQDDRGHQERPWLEALQLAKESKAKAAAKTMPDRGGRPDTGAEGASQTKKQLSQPAHPPPPRAYGAARQRTHPTTPPKAPPKPEGTAAASEGSRKRKAPKSPPTPRGSAGGAPSTQPPAKVHAWKKLQPPPPPPPPPPPAASGTIPQHVPQNAVTAAGQANSGENAVGLAWQAFFTAKYGKSHTVSKSISSSIPSEKAPADSNIVCCPKCGHSWNHTNLK